MKSRLRSHVFVRANSQQAVGAHRNSFCGFKLRIATKNANHCQTKIRGRLPNGPLSHRIGNIGQVGIKENKFKTSWPVFLNLLFLEFPRKRSGPASYWLKFAVRRG
jgi:hypothetical protein